MMQSEDRLVAATQAPPPAQAPPPEPFEYYDAGNHWCQNCNVTSGSMFDFFTHLQSKSHRKTLDPYDRPWASEQTKTLKGASEEEKLTKPAKGSEFLLPVRGFFCLLCRQFYGDAICAEDHVTSHAHNEKYKKQMYENPLYEQRRNLDRQAGLSSDNSGKKRKREDDEKGGKDDDKSKHKKEKKDKKKEEEEKPKGKDNEEEKVKQNKKEENSKNMKTPEQEGPFYNKKNGDDKYKYSKKEDKYRYSQENEERADRYRHSREDDYWHRHRKDEEEGKYRYNKYSESKSKYERERDEVKLKTEEEFKKSEPVKSASKPEASKAEQIPPKPYDPPKIFCGPSPAMRAKLRKQSLEAGKPAPATPSFGKFMWRKKETVLEKEAQKVAAEFIKDEEAAAKEAAPSTEDSFAKSMAVAKEIAQKLAGQPTGTYSWVPSTTNRGRIRPNFPRPGGFQNKSTTVGRLTPLNTSVSMRPQTSGFFGAPQTKGATSPDVVSNPPNFPAVGPPETVGLMPPPPTPGLPKPASTQKKLDPESSLTKSPLHMLGSQSPVKPSAPVSGPAPPEAKPLSTQTAPAPSVKAKVTPTQETMIKIVPDVAAPGVPEDEQTLTVFVKPPPFMKISEGNQKFEKSKSNLAAAKAQDLLGVFYRSIGQSGPSVTKPASDITTDKRHPLSAPQPNPQPKPESNPQTKSHPEPKPEPQPQSLLQPKSQPHPEPKPEPQPQSIQQSEIQPRPHLKPEPQPKSLPRPESQPRPDPKPETQPESLPHLEPQTHPKPTPEPQPQSLLQHESQPRPRLDPESFLTKSPLPKPQPESLLQLESQLQTQSQTKHQTQSDQEPHTWRQPQTEGQQTSHGDLNGSPTSPLTQTNVDIQISSVWSLQNKATLSASAENTPNKDQPNQSSHLQCKLQTSPPNQSSTPESESMPTSAPQVQTELRSEPEPDLPEKTPEHEPRPGPKTRAKRTPPAPRPTRQTRSQTRSQTRYQTRQQQQQEDQQDQSQAEADPESVSGDLDTSELSSECQLELVPPGEDPETMEVTAQTLDLPADMTYLNFDYTFNFE